ncbi:MAG: hypothetical protein JXA87_03800 [Thermoleophilia bacterium]|nr:hypothetical protein [Thermoleophilia bacterium]
MAKKAQVTITYTGPGVYTYDAGKAILRPGESALAKTPLASHWKALLASGKATAS